MNRPLFKVGDHVRSTRVGEERRRGRIFAVEELSPSQGYLYSIRRDSEANGPFTPLYAWESDMTWVDGLSTILDLLP